MTIVLIGLKHAGKTSVGQYMASHLKYTFVDTDKLLEFTGIDGQYGSVRELYQQCGALAFRLAEKKVIRTLKPSKRHVVATGGGSVMDEDNVKHLQRLGPLVYLRMNLDTFRERIKQNTLPAYLPENIQDNQLEAIYHQRRAVYEAVSDVSVQVEGLSVSELVHHVIRSTISF